MGRLPPAALVSYLNETLAFEREALDELQKPGGKRLPATEFIKGFPLEGKRFV